ncbi:MAG: VacJ family lipoprotein [Rhodocyclales bacterium GT-UBC]|nr:MAG: VacJ family lipoprotein [Rhodocyclales bacterium GT-UBC]
MTARRGFFSLHKCLRHLLACILVIAWVGDSIAEGGAHDPLEGFNRAMFSVNEAVDGYAVKPVAQVYDRIVPLPAKVGVGNFFGNAGDLWIGINSALQGKFSDAGSDIGRLLINSTVGILGLFDVASELGLDKHDEDFGQTLAVWGVADGVYLFFPVIGPRTVRDTFGWALDSYSDPLRAVVSVPVRNSLLATRIVDVRAGLLPADKVVDEGALDKYSYIRGAYLQRRRNQVFDGRPPRLDD